MAVYTEYQVKCLDGHTTIGDKNITHCGTCGAKVAMGWTVRTERKSDLTEGQRLERVIDWLQRNNDRTRVEDWGYCLPLQPADADFEGQLIVIADWNTIPSNVQNYLEDKCNVLTGFDDEHTLCSECSNVICTTPTSYGDEGNYAVGDGWIMCQECIDSDPQGMIDECINDSARAVKSHNVHHIESAGFTCLERETEDCPVYATGWHPGQNDDPHAVAQWVESNLPNHDYVFAIDDVGQFDCHWKVYVRPKDYEGE